VREVEVGMLLELLLYNRRRAKVEEFLLDFITVLFMLSDVAGEISHHVERAFIEKTNVFSAQK